jgi:integrase
MAAPDVPVPNLVRDALRRDGAYDFGLGVVLRAPADPAGGGGSASYRVEHRVAPLVPGRPAPARRQGYSRDLAVAYARAQAIFDEMQQRAGGTYVEYHTEVPFGAVVQRWQDSPHPRWGAHYPDKVASLLRCWVVADAVTVHWRPAGPPTPIADLPVGALTADHYNQALEHVRRARAHRTYTEVHGLVAQILKWALANRYLRPTDSGLLSQLPLARAEDGSPSIGLARSIPPEEIPPVPRVQALADVAAALFGPGVATLVNLLAFSGLRISEALALRHDDRFQRGDDGCWRIEVREQVHRTHRRTLPPKWHKHRWAFLPHWVSEDVDALLARTRPGALLFPSPGRRVRTASGAIERVGVGYHPYTNWRERVWAKLVEATPGWPERDDWWPPDAGPAPAGTQSERRWRWPVHTLRHVCATYQLNELGLDPDDVAKFLGHRSGVQVWEMYVRVRADLFGRAAAASRAAGDPRTRPPSGERSPR